MSFSDDPVSGADLLVLCYHAVSPRWPSELAVHPDQLERQLAYLVDRGYRGATFTAALSAPVGQRTVVVTFDDAFRSVAELAQPILDRFGVPGTVFVPTAFIGQDQPMSWPGIEEWRAGPWAHELLPMTEQQLRHVAEAGWEIGSHAHTHPRLTLLDDEALAEELSLSRRLCGQLVGGSCAALAYPYGNFDERVVAAAAVAGYRVAATLPDWFHPARPLTWPRVYVARDDQGRRFQTKVDPRLRRLRASKLWSRLEAARGGRARPISRNR